MSQQQRSLSQIAPLVTPDPLWSQRQAELTALIERFTCTDGRYHTVIEPLWLYRFSTPPEPTSYLHQTALCIAAQARKHIFLANECYVYDRDRYMVVSLDLPITSRIIEATPDAPYLGIRLALDPRTIAELIAEADLPVPDNHSPRRGIVVNQLDLALLDALVRLLHLLDSPRDIPVLAPLIMREIHYRLICGDQAIQLRSIATANSHIQRIARALSLLKAHFAESLRIEDIAHEVHMSPSGLHYHFKAVTAMSPLQFQKQLRLQEARRLMLEDGLGAGEAGFRVGYESPSQFTREYSRLFGAPPQRDIAQLRGSAQAAIREAQQ